MTADIAIVFSVLAGATATVAIPIVPIANVLVVLPVFWPLTP